MTELIFKYTTNNKSNINNTEILFKIKDIKIKLQISRCLKN